MEAEADVGMRMLDVGGSGCQGAGENVVAIDVLGME